MIADKNFLPPKLRTMNPKAEYIKNISKWTEIGCFAIQLVVIILEKSFILMYVEHEAR